MKRFLASFFLLLLVPLTLGTMVVNPYRFGAAGGGGTPTFELELTAMRFIETGSSSSTATTVTSAIASGRTVIVCATTAGQTAASVSDSQGNTYTAHTAVTAGDSTYIRVFSGYITTSLTTSDTISITWGSPAFTFRSGAFFTATGCASAGQPDQATGAASFSSSPSASASTTAANTVLIGIVEAPDSAGAYTVGSGWTISGALHTVQNGNNRAYYVYKNASAAAAQDPAGSYAGATNWAVSWVALK